MLSNFIKPKACLDDQSTLWLFDTFAWAMRNLDSRVFYEETILVTPSNEHFPGTENTAHGMANLIFNQVKEHAGVKHWPTKLINMAAGRPVVSPRIQIEGALRGSRGIMPTGEVAHQLTIAYNPDQLRNPEVQRGNALSQYDITYALAIFSCLKGIPAREVLVHLKKTLRPFYRKAAKEVMRKTEELDRVRANQ